MTTIEAVPQRTRLALGRNRLKGLESSHRIETVIDTGEIVYAQVPNQEGEDFLEHGPPLILEPISEWFQPIDAFEAGSIMRRCTHAKELGRLAFSIDRVEWGHPYLFTRHTSTSPPSSFAGLTDATSAFIQRYSLCASISWLMQVADSFFPGASFVIDFLPSEREEDDLLALEVHASFDPKDFRNRRHMIAEAIRGSGLNKLYDVISIFQRRVQQSGWQNLSSYSSVSPE